jgi:hypothetical protein
LTEDTPARPFRLQYRDGAARGASIARNEPHVSDRDGRRFIDRLIVRAIMLKSYLAFS